MAFQKVAFIGLGLIGGSIAKKIRTTHPDTIIYAIARRTETIEEAYKEGIINNPAPLSFADLSDCDHIFLCAPVEKNIEYLQELKPIIRQDCCISDVGSTKTKIHEEVIRLNLERNFIGGHPMTGSEKTGVKNAKSSLLENAYYIITPTKQTTTEQLDEFYHFVKELGSIPLVLDYKTHDYATASISHLPHMIAFTLVNLVKDIDDESETMKTIAAGGFKDITRIASSSPVMWENICTSNREPILQLMDMYMDRLATLREWIAKGDSKSLISYFQTAKDYRDSFQIPSDKSPNKVHEIYLDLMDAPGQIAIIANLLAHANISIKNIGIIHNREFEEGVLRIEFYDAGSKKRAIEILHEHDYVLYRHEN